MTKTFFEITAQAGTTPHVYIFDEIGGYGISAKNFIDAIAPHKGGPLNVTINSPGGSVFEGFAIYEELNNWGHPVHINVGPLCASIASAIAMAGTTITASETSMIMVHNPRTFIEADANECRKWAGTLDKIRDTMAGVYAKRAKKSRAELIEAMDSETWLTAAEAKAWGFIDAISAPVRSAAEFNLKNFAKVPGAITARIDTAALVARCNDFEQKYKAEVRQRIAAKVEALQPGRFPLAQSDKWIEDAMKDETVLDRLAEISQAPIGTEPVAGEFNHIQNSTLENLNKAHAEKLKKLRGR